MTEVLVSVEERVRDAGLAADRLEGDRFAALDERADCLFGGAGLGLGLGVRRCVEDRAATGPVVTHRGPCSRDWYRG